MAGIKSSFKNPIFKLEPFLKNRLIEKKTRLFKNINEKNDTNY